MPKILAGEFRSRSLQTLPGVELTRPILSRVKESVFGMLHEWFDGARVLDLFAGVGTVGLEAVSRGACDVLMVERDAKVFRVLQQNIELLNCSDRAKAIQADALAQTCLMRAPQPVDLVFVDPPYSLMRDEGSRQRVLDQIGRCRPIMGDKGFVVLRSPLGPEEIDLSIDGFVGPEPHQYRKDMWALLYEPAQKTACSEPGDVMPG